MRGTPGAPVVGALDLAGRAAEVLSVEKVALAAATGKVVDESRRDVVLRHAGQPGARAVGLTLDGALVGLAYGYVEAPGGWWDSYVRPALRRAGAEIVLEDAFCLVELHVLPELQGQGYGRALLVALLDPVRYPRVVATTQDGPNPARGFYAHLGFVEPAAVSFGDGPQDQYVVLARDLPLAP